jgi:hypothetical protein
VLRLVYPDKQDLLGRLVLPDKADQLQTLLLLLSS